MNMAERIKLVRAMETVARCINDESIFASWLMCGVADGDIDKDTTDEELEFYAEDDILKDTIGCFLRCMTRAGKVGGLYIDGIVADKEDR